MAKRRRRANKGRVSSPTQVNAGSAPTVLDVAIVGAGPAGGAAALALAGKGLRVGIIEKAVPPRYKTCGGGVLWRAVRRLPIDIRGAIERECWVAELVHHDPDLRFVCRREHPIVSMVMRDQFDHLLVSAAQRRGGVELFAGTSVRDVQTTSDDVRLATSAGEFRARYVIAADGVNSIVAKKTARTALRDIVPAFECEATYAEDVMAPWLEAARFDFGLVPAGYGWVFPKAGHLSIGVGTTRRGAANLPEYYERYLARLGFGAALHEERHGYMIPCRPRADLFDLPRILFVGDAAGLADPVTAEGISAGIISGQLAAQAIGDGPEDVRNVQRRYRAALEAGLLADLRVARWLAWLLYERPRWCAALLSRQGQGMSELMTRIVCGETTYRAAVRRPAHYVRLLMRRKRRPESTAVAV